jgi:hypothetical protein
MVPIGYKSIIRYRMDLYGGAKLEHKTKVISVRPVQMLADSVLTVLSQDPENFSYNCGPEVPIRSFTLLLSGDLGYVNMFELSPSCRTWTSHSPKWDSGVEVQSWLILHWKNADMAPQFDITKLSLIAFQAQPGS